MTDEELEYCESVIAEAWRDDAASLEQLRDWVGTDPPGTAPKVFHVGLGGLLRDPTKRKASKRSDVYLSFEKFGSRDPLLQGTTTSEAIEDVCNCPPLAKVFEAAALSLQPLGEAPARRTGPGRARAGVDTPATQGARRPGPCGVDQLDPLDPGLAPRQAGSHDAGLAERAD
jgi:hypothetical protein